MDNTRQNQAPPATTPNRSTLVHRCRPPLNQTATPVLHALAPPQAGRHTPTTLRQTHRAPTQLQGFPTLQQSRISPIRPRGGRFANGTTSASAHDQIVTSRISVGPPPAPGRTPARRAPGGPSELPGAHTPYDTLNSSASCCNTQPRSQKTPTHLAHTPTPVTFATLYLSYLYVPRCFPPVLFWFFPPH